jgi:flagellar biosynthesis/type III secretory pathway ATPase
LITIGAYTRGSNPKWDQAIERNEPLMNFLKQPMTERSDRVQAWQKIVSALRG